MTIVATLAMLSEFRKPIETPYRRSEPLQLRVNPPTEPVRQNSVVEIPLDLHATFDNPFDPEDIRVDADVIGPVGSPISVPGFFYGKADRKLDGVNETIKVGATGWAIRFCPKTPGDYRITVRVTDRTGTKAAASPTIHATSDSTEGFIHLDPTNKKFFAFENGKSYWPLGPNTAWAGSRGTFDYDDWLSEYGKSGANYGRLWLGPHWTTFALERPGKAEEGKGLGQLDLGNAWRIDYVLREAQKFGINLMLTFDSYNELRDKDAYNQWEAGPHNSDNGGPLRVWNQFWTSPAMEKIYRDRLRYLVARYAAYRNVFAWEFWNEVDLVRDYRLSEVGPWHRRMGQYLRSIDPYKHLVSTSMSDPMGSRELQLLPELDFVQSHIYSDSITEAFIGQQQRKAQWGRAHYAGEVGADAGGPRREDDPTGLQVHDPIWASIATASSGNAASWWWDNLIHPNKLYGIYAVAAKFVDGIDWGKEDFQQADPVMTFTDPNVRAMPSDLVFDSGIVGWTAGPEYQPRTVTIVNGKVVGDGNLAGIMHGKVNHPELSNPITFDIRTTKPTRFEVEVNDVSGYGGASLRISLDGDRRLSRDFLDTNAPDKHETLRQYAGRYGIDIPAGRHTILVENPGKDWFTGNFRFKDLVLLARPNVNCWATIGNNTVMAWIRAQGRSWRALCVKKEKNAPVMASSLNLDGLASGEWTGQVVDTWTGEIVARRNCVVRNDGKAKIDLPPFDKDLAVKLVRSH